MTILPFRRSSNLISLLIAGARYRRRRKPLVSVYVAARTKSGVWEFQL